MNDEDILRNGYYLVEEHGSDHVKPKKKNVKVAYVGSKKLYRGLQTELSVDLVESVEDACFLFKYSSVDFLLIETALECAVKDWSYALINGSNRFSMLEELVKSSNLYKIPVVLWNTKDVQYFELFTRLSKLSDFVFAADERALIEYEDIAVSARILPPCAPVKLFNPYNKHLYKEKISILYDGIASAHRKTDVEECLKKFSTFGLKVIDSNNHVRSSKLLEIEGLQKTASVLGCVPDVKKPNLLKSSAMSICIGFDLKSDVSRCWEIVESLASGVPVLFVGPGYQTQFLSEAIRHSVNVSKLVQEASRLQTDSEYHHALSLNAWRFVMRGHTLAHRLDAICSEVGLDLEEPFVNWPLATVYTPTNRPQQIRHAIDQYDAQTYPNKELLLIFNGSSFDGRMLDEINARKDVRWISIPEENFTGALMKAAFEFSQGDLAFKLDDDDTYGCNYLWDLVAHYVATGVQLFGKPPSPYYCFENSNRCYLNKNTHLENVVGYDTALKPGGVGKNYWLGGNSISGAVDYLSTLDYPREAYAAADSSFLLSTNESGCEFLVADRSNLIVNRRADPKSHTWRVSAEEVGANSMELPYSTGQLLEMWNKFPVPLGLSEDGSGVGVIPPPQKRESIVVGVASIPSRVVQLRMTLASILPQVDKVYVYLNNYDDVPSYLNHEKITYFLSRDHGDLGAAGKFFKIDDVNDGYYFSIDDDIIYPSDYVSRFVNTLKKYNNNSIVTCHGSIFASPLEWYFERNVVYATKNELGTDKFVTLIGSGCSAFYRSSLSVSFSDLYPNVMCDLRLSVMAREQGLTMVSLSRPKNWLRPQEVDESESYYVKMLNDDGGRSKLASSYDWNFSVYGEEVREWLEKNFPKLTLSEAEQSNLDLDFIRALKGGGLPRAWNTSVSLPYHKRRLQYLDLQLYKKFPNLYGEPEMGALTRERDIVKLRDLIEQKEAILAGEEG
ncbi:glycosyltransferase [Microbulbifer agarilyticus]|uniref:glycosyltransferase n=1 Tax=Microbulbifer agarilyticus TaxID=260552 RepID=UPI001C941567|nr:glycosyltransferase [Microbulbifer agarilyticus]MBY6189177.1 glycosyltransferase [Microbulbifer agarilyticus]